MTPELEVDAPRRTRSDAASGRDNIALPVNASDEPRFEPARKRLAAPKTRPLPPIIPPGIVYPLPFMLRLR